VTPANEDAPGGTDLAEVARSVLVYQAVITVLVAATFLIVSGFHLGAAAFYGGACALILTWLRKRGISGVSGLSPGKSMLRLYLGAAQRFVWVLVLFAVALAVLKLDPLVCIIGFALSQAGYLLNWVLQKGQSS
jgi:F0F1-type ATP synthase assembly protein I